MVLRIQVSVQILIPLIFYSSQFILLIFHSCEHLQLTGVCCDFCDCIFSQECDSVTSALVQETETVYQPVQSIISTDGMTVDEYTANFEMLARRTGFNEAALEDAFV